MKLNIESAKEQVCGIKEELNINPIDELSIEIEDLNNIIESLSGDEYKNTRYNLEVIVEDKLAKGFSIIIEKIEHSDDLESEHKVDRNVISSFFTKIVPYMQRHYENFKKAKIKILSNIASSNDNASIQKAKSLLANIEYNLGKYKSGVDKAMHKTGWEMAKDGTMGFIGGGAVGGAISAGALGVLGTVPVVGLSMIGLLIIGKALKRNINSNTIKDTGEESFSKVVTIVTNVSDTSNIPVIITGLEEALKLSNEGIKALDSAITTLKGK